MQPGAPIVASVEIRRRLHAQYLPLESGDRAIDQTIARMKQLVNSAEGARSPEIRALATQITRAVANRDFRGEQQAIFDWVKSNIRFTGEYDETLQAPTVTVQLGAGDCDDHAMLTAALLRALGHEVRFVTIAADPEAPGVESHVYTEAMDRSTGEWVALDTTVRDSHLGWAPRERVTRRRDWPVLGFRRNSLQGIGHYRPRLGETQNQPTTAQQIQQAIQPLTDAAAYRIKYGDQGPQYSVNLNGMAWAFFGLAAGVMLLGGGRHR